ncbi:hypothetical protein Tco_0461204 [Tanacetum coccineum]
MVNMVPHEAFACSCAGTTWLRGQMKFREPDMDCPAQTSSDNVGSFWRPCQTKLAASTAHRTGLYTSESHWDLTPTTAA